MNRMGYEQPHLTSTQIMDEIAELTPSFHGISHARLDSAEVAGNGLQWPCTGKTHPGTPIMHVGKFTRGKGIYSLAEYIPPAELPDESYPLMLTTGRILYHYNATAMTDKTPGLNEICGHSFIEINTADAQKLGIEDGARVRVESRRGSIESQARVSGKTNPGETRTTSSSGATSTEIREYVPLPCVMSSSSSCTRPWLATGSRPTLRPAARYRLP